MKRTLLKCHKRIDPTTEGITQCDDDGDSGVAGEWDRDENTMEEDDEDEEEVVEEDEDDEDCSGRWEEEEQEEEGPHQQDHVDVTNMMFFSTSHTLFEVIEQQTSVTSKL